LLYLSGYNANYGVLCEKGLKSEIAEVKLLVLRITRADQRENPAMATKVCEPLKEGLK
jgi:hypothetical protein